MRMRIYYTWPSQASKFLTWAFCLLRWWSSATRKDRVIGIRILGVELDWW